MLCCAPPFTAAQSTGGGGVVVVVWLGLVFAWPLASATSLIFTILTTLIPYMRPHQYWKFCTLSSLTSSRCRLRSQALRTLAAGVPLEKPGLEDPGGTARLQWQPAGGRYLGAPAH